MTYILNYELWNCSELSRYKQIPKWGKKAENILPVGITFFSLMLITNTRYE